MWPPANHFYVWAVAQCKLHSSYSRHLFIKPVHYIHPLSYILLLQHRSPKLYPLQWWQLVRVTKSKIMLLLLPYFLFSLFPHTTFSLYHLLPLNTPIVKYLSTAVPRASVIFQTQKVALTELFCKWEVREGIIQNLQIPVLNLLSIQEISQHKARAST